MYLTLFEQIGRELNFTSILIALGVIAGVSLVMGLLIVFISRVCKVEEDPRIGEVEGLLAGANCGACGHPGCSGYAKALCQGSASLDDCGQTSSENKSKICQVLGIEADAGERKIAVVHCAGGDKAKDNYAYSGYPDCMSESLAAGGGRKACAVGCLGNADCAKACPYGSIDMMEGRAKVDSEKCRSCGICLKTCPKSLIQWIPESATVYVACSSKCRGKDVMSQCEVGCIGCGMCARVCPSGAITMVDNLPVFDYSKCTHCDACFAKCPKKIIRHVHAADEHKEQIEA